MKKPQFAEYQIYHIYNRGVEKRVVFLTDKDYRRFVYNLVEFNNDSPAINFSRRIEDLNEVEPHSKKKKLVEILAFTLMPNHFHLIIEQKMKSGIVRFMQKLGTGYTMYFNKVYKRVGPLFQGRFKASHIKSEAHFLHIPYYVHTNPIDLLTDRGSTSLKRQIDFLENYKWSSFRDYLGKPNFPLVTSREFLLESIGGSACVKVNTIDWLKNRKHNLDIIADIILD